MATKPLGRLEGCADHSWLEQLTADPESGVFAAKDGNKQMRQVKSGHYVLVEPTPLPEPRLVIHSPAMASALGFSEADAHSEDFVAFFSGEHRRAPSLRTWCTPYALSIMGQRQLRNCPFGNGNGYGDGRAISVGEVVVNGHRWEMQLKGSGTTPFCRGGDGRAVLRSSIREFLASEAMFNLGIDTTRALSLVVSKSETAMRQWYRPGTRGENPNMEAGEKCAITTRVAPSFLRVGHIDLFARRASSRKPTEQQLREHAQLVEHALFREYPDISQELPLADRALLMLERAAERFGALVAGWLRVGFCQGNFNADNCLISGRTMDYGPFGWMDQYSRYFAKWVGSGEHFSFLAQPEAALANYATLVDSVLPVLSYPPEVLQQKRVRLLKRGTAVIYASVAGAFRAKLGFTAPPSAGDRPEMREDFWEDAVQMAGRAQAPGKVFWEVLGRMGFGPAAELMESLEPMLQKSAMGSFGVDYTIFFRELASVAELPETDAELEKSLLAPVQKAFYGTFSEQQLGEFAKWLRRWRAALAADPDAGGLPQVAARLRATNPKYVPREWMLADAYRKAEDQGNYGAVHELYQLFLHPYDEQPDFEEKYYRRAPDSALTDGGLAKMT